MRVNSANSANQAHLERSFVYYVNQNLHRSASLPRAEQEKEIKQIYKNLVAVSVMAGSSAPQFVNRVSAATQLVGRLKLNADVQESPAKVKLKKFLANPLEKIVSSGLKAHSPSLIKEGANGTYLYKNKLGAIVAVGKPSKEESGGIENPKGMRGSLINQRTGIDAGNNYKREITAYQLDTSHASLSFAHVPFTASYAVKKKSALADKLEDAGDTGSLQAFVDNAKMVNTLSDQEKMSLSVEEVQRIALQDMRMLNADRHFGNLLVDENFRLIPIDHGLCFPNNARRLVYEWMRLEQSKQPLSAVCKKYVDAIDIEADVHVMRQNGIEEAAIERTRLATALIKHGVASGLTAYQLGEIFISGVATESSLKWHTRWEKDGHLPKDGNSFFEEQICERYFQGEDIEALVESVVSAYVADSKVAAEQVFSSTALQQHSMGNGFQLIKFNGEMFVADRQTSVFRLKNLRTPETLHHMRLTPRL